MNEQYIFVGFSCTGKLLYLKYWYHVRTILANDQVLWAKMRLDLDRMWLHAL